MKLIKPSFEIIEQQAGLEGIYKMIELAGRVCHKSEDKITETSTKEFVERMLKMKHLSTCEFGTVYLYYKVDKPSTMVKEIIDFYKNNQYSKVKCIKNYSNTYSECGMGRLYDTEYSEYFITTNMRVCLENNRQEYLTNALCEPTEYHYKRYTVRYICDRAIANEIVRHRKFSFLQESTRYCRYSADKFNGELTFILPCWFEEMGQNVIKFEEGKYKDTYCFQFTGDNIGKSCSIWYNAMREAEEHYIELINLGWKAEQARDILPLSLKTELYMCGYAEDWEKFFGLRCAPNSHPQARELAIPLKEEFIKRGYINE